MRSDQHRRRIKNDSQEYSHPMYTSIPDHEMTDAETSRFAVILYGWLALLIVAALIGYSLKITNPKQLLPSKNLHGNQGPI